MIKSILAIVLFFTTLFCYGQSFDSYFDQPMTSAEYEIERLMLPQLNEIIKANPLYIDAYISRGWNKYRLKDFAGALEDLDVAVTYKALNIDAHMNRGIVLFALKDYNQAIEEMNIVIHIDPKSSTAYYNRGVAQYYLGNKWMAIADYDKSIELWAPKVDAYLKRAEAYYSLGDKYKTYACSDLLKAKEVKLDDVYLYKLDNELYIKYCSIH